MAQILDFNTPSVNPAGAPPNDYLHIQASPGMFGAFTGQALEKLGGSFEKVGQAATEVAELHDRINIDDQTNQFIEARNRILYGDPNKQVMGPDGQPAVDRGFLGLEGRAASDARADTLKAIEEARQQGRSNLKNPMAQLAYDSQTRRIYAEAETHIGQHTDQQWKVWAGGVNGAGAGLELQEFVNSIGDPAKMEGAAHNYINFKVQQAQLKFGDDAKIKEATEAQAKLELLEAQVNAVAVRDPARAIQILDSNKTTAGVKYDDMYSRLRQRAEQQTGITKANQYVAMATGAAGASMVAAHKGEAADAAAAAWRNAGMSPNGIAGVMFNINEESSFNPTLRHPDQPRFSPDDERHYAHGLYQEGAEEWARYDNWLKASHPGADWRDPRLQSEFAAWNLKTNYPGTWERMNAAATPEQAAAIYAREYLKPAAANLQSRLAKIGQGVAPASAGTMAPAVYTPTGATAPAAAPEAIQRGQPTLADRLGAALRSAIADPDMNDHERDIAVRAIESQFRVLEITENQNTKARKEASDNAAGGYVTALADMMHTPNPDYVQLTGRIAHDPNLTWEAKERLLDRVKHVSGEEQALAFGPGYMAAREALFSPPDAPGHIDDFSELVMRPDITTAGLNDLNTRLRLVKGDVDHQALERRINSFLTGAKKDLSFEEDNGFIKIRDPKGEQIYNYQFVPDFVKRASDLAQDAQKTGDRKKLDEFLSVENVKKMVRSYRSKKDMDADKLTAMGQSVGAKEDPNAPLPPAPEGIKDENWKAVVAKPPMLTTGQAATHTQWAQALTLLNSDPSPQMVANFDRYFAPAGLKALDVLRKINPAGAIAAEKTGKIGLDERPEAFDATEAARGAAAHQGNVAPTVMPAPEMPRPIEALSGEFKREQEDPHNPAIRFRNWIQMGLHPETAKEKRHPEDIR